MIGRKFFLYAVLMIAQILLGAFLNLGPWLVFSLLPSLILCLPVGQNVPVSMVIAFALGLAADFFTDGVLGLTSLALVPVALMRKPVIGLVFGGEIFSRGEQVSTAKQGLPKMSMALLALTAIYFAIYVWVDAAGTRSFGFNTLRWALSTLLSTLLQIPVAGLITSWEEKGWK